MMMILGSVVVYLIILHLLHLINEQNIRKPCNPDSMMKKILGFAGLT